MSRHTGNDVTLLPLIIFFAMYLSLCTSLNETVCSCAVILVDCTGIARTGVGSHGCMPLHKPLSLMSIASDYACFINVSTNHSAFVEAAAVSEH